MKDITIGIELKVEDAPYNETVRRLNEVSNLLNNLGKQVAPATTRAMSGYSAAVRKATGAVEKQTKALGGGIRVQGKTIGEVKELEDVSKLVSDQYHVMTTEITATNRLLKMASRGALEAGKAEDYLAEQLGVTAEEMPRVVAGFQEYNRQSMVAQITTAAVAHQIGATGKAWRMFGRAAFWAGLGTMFVTMSIARANRALYSITQSYRILKRTQRDITEAQSEYTEAVFLYGRRSDEANAAAIRLRDAQESLQAATYGVREAHESWNLTLLMLGLGTAPTLIRGISDISVSLRTLLTSLIANKLVTIGFTEAQAANAVVTLKTAGIRELLSLSMKKEITLKTLATGITYSEATASGTASAAKGVEAGVTAGLTVATKGLTLAKLGLIAATGVGIVVVGAWIATMMAAQAAMEGMEQQTEDYSESLRNLPIRSHSPLEIKTTQGWTQVSELEKLGGGAGSLAGISTGHKTVNINVQGPWYIREEADIYKVAKEIKRIEMRGVRNRSGGRL